MGTFVGVTPDGIAPLLVDAVEDSFGNVDNTSDANKPVSTATQTALDTKVASTTINHIVTLSQVAYDALTPASDTLYVIT